MTFGKLRENVTFRQRSREVDLWPQEPLRADTIRAPRSAAMVAVTHARKTRKSTRKASPVIEFKEPAPVHCSPRTENRAWEPEEDEVLLAAVQEFGAKWKVIAQTLAGRSEAMHGVPRARRPVSLPVPIRPHPSLITPLAHIFVSFTHTHTQHTLQQPCS